VTRTKISQKQRFIPKGKKPEIGQERKSGLPWRRRGQVVWSSNEAAETPFLLCFFVFVFFFFFFFLCLEHRVLD
jgi:hypothetical protein